MSRSSQQQQNFDLFNILYIESIEQVKQLQLVITLFQELLLLISIFYQQFQMEIQESPTLYPTWKEFKNFSEYVEKVDRMYKDRYGMVKVVPPPEWKHKCANYNEKLQNLTVSGPIEQNIFGKGGVYQCLHIQKKSMSLKQYKLKMGVFDKITDGLSASEVQTMVTLKLQQFWKNIVFSPPLYGADLLNTLMDERAGTWNLNNLDSLLKYAIDVNVRGVTTSYCYIGSWKTLFCWHKEDLDLSAINYLHEGKSKFWYSIPSNQSYILEKQAKTYFPEHFSKCSQYLRHKTTLINPYNLKKKYPQLNISKMEHKVGEFMLVLGGSYHCGFNFGCNIAQAINYGTLDWLAHLSESKVCNCSRNSVRANNIAILKNLQNTSFAKTKEFGKFKADVFKEVQREEEEEEKRNQKIGVKGQFSKKIKKQKKLPKQLKFNGQEYKIESWAQCDKCNVWRKLATKIKDNKSFKCSDISKHCHSRDKIEQNYITL